MDIDLLSKMIGELILVNDEVALPELGSFVAEMVPATFSDRGYTINPPYRRLVFRQRPQNDALLAGLYAKSNGISAEDAARILKDFMIGLKRELRDKKTVVFPSLGRLRATKENHYFFVADEDLDIWPEGFGLRPVSLKTNEETEEEVSQALDMLSKEIVQPAPEPVPVQPVLEPQPVPLASPEPKKKMKVPAAVWTVLVILVLLAAFVVAFLVTARVNPDLVDRFLYTKEELEILRYQL